MPATSIPHKLVPDWDALYEVLIEKGGIVIYSPISEHRIMTHGAVESPTVKGFINHVRLIRKQKPLTKRIGAERWYVTLG